MKTLRSLFFGFRNVQKPLDLWENVGKYYVGRFRYQIDEAAEKLSTKTPISTRFNSDRNCGELFFAGGGVTIAQINVHGEFGLPYEAVISSASPFPEDVKNVLRSIFPDTLPVKFISVL